MLDFWVLNSLKLTIIAAAPPAVAIVIPPAVRPNDAPSVTGLNANPAIPPIIDIPDPPIRALLTFLRYSFRNLSYWNPLFGSFIYLFLFFVFQTGQNPCIIN